ncbi:MAG: ThuA domain-containing protein [Candidatus Methylacidiphilales bacterium]
MKIALIVAGGWDGHQPLKFATAFQNELRTRGVEAQIETSLDVFADVQRLQSCDLIFPCWTMGTLTSEQSKGLQTAVRGGVGLGGIHGGMGDAFRGNLDYEWMTGGHFVGHPHVGDYTVTVRDASNPITEGVASSFAYNSEQYYMMVDPSIHVLADTQYTYEGHTCTMPVAWTKQWGKGRVFYSALGHKPEELTDFPDSFKLALNGLTWAAGA